MKIYNVCGENAIDWWISDCLINNRIALYIRWVTDYEQMSQTNPKIMKMPTFQGNCIQIYLSPNLREIILVEIISGLINNIFSLNFWWATVDLCRNWTHKHIVHKNVPYKADARILTITMEQISPHHEEKSVFMYSCWQIFSMKFTCFRSWIPPFHRVKSTSRYNFHVSRFSSHHGPVRMRDVRY